MLRLLSSIKSYLDNISLGWWIFIILLGLLVLFAGSVYVYKKRITERNLLFLTALVVYMAVILVSTVLHREILSGTYASFRSRIDLRIFSNWTEKINSGYGGKSEILLNILMFVPIGLLASEPADKDAIRVFTLVTLFTFAIECMQLFFRKGIFELTDIIENIAGGVIGYFIYLIADRLIGFIKKF